MNIYELIFNINNHIPNLTINIQLALDNRNYLATLDTGSNFCLINENIVKDLILNTTDLPHIYAANNKPIKVLGKIKLNIIIEQIAYPT